MHNQGMNPLLVVFKRPEQNPKVRELMTGLNGLEIPHGAWLVPSAAPPAVFASKLSQLMGSDDGFFVVRIFRPDSPMCVVNFPYLPEWLLPDYGNR